MFLAEEEAHELHPFCLTEGMEFLVAEVRDEGDARLLDGIVTTSLEGRDEDDLRLCCQDEFRVEVAFHAYLDDASVVHSRPYIFIKKILGARDATHDIQCIQRREVRELQHRHHDGAVYGNVDGGIGRGNGGGVCWHQCEVVAHRHPVLVGLRISDVHQPYAVGQRPHPEAPGIVQLQRIDDDQRRVCVACRTGCAAAGGQGEYDCRNEEREQEEVSFQSDHRSMRQD